MHWTWLLFAPAMGYQCLTIVATLRYAVSQRKLVKHRTNPPPVSVLKPVLGLDPNTYQAFRSQADQDYPDFELLFAVRDPADPAVAAVHQLQREFPGHNIRLIQATTTAPNGKVASLIDLAREAKHPIWVVNDSDIAVTPCYLRSITAPLEDEAIGVVTCPYRALAHSVPTRWEALGIATDFMPSTMTAQMLGVRDFGFGSTLAFRAEDLQQAGGFELFSEYLADDYQLAHRISLLGKRALLSPYVVDTALGEASWRGVWFHQLRWARTIVRSMPAGYAGLPMAHAGLWAVVALLAAGTWRAAAVLVILRCMSALVATLTLRARQGLPYFWLAPFWDLFAFAIWLAAWSGNTVLWRGRKLHLDRKGRIAKS